jgi:hypothetical protein
MISIRKEWDSDGPGTVCHGTERRKMLCEFVESRQRVPARENSVRNGSVI